MANWVQLTPLAGSNGVEHFNLDLAYRITAGKTGTRIHFVRSLAPGEAFDLVQVSESLNEVLKLAGQPDA